MQTIQPCLWFNGQAEEASKFYTSTFKHSEIGRTTRYTSSSSEVSGQKIGSIMTVEFNLMNLKMLALNGGPDFQFTPAVSFFVSVDTKSQIDQLWKSLSTGGKTMMELKSYPWSEYYGWCQDKFGVSWQLMFETGKSRISPALLFMDKIYGKGEEAIGFYTSIFPNSKVEAMHRDTKSNTVMHSVLKLGNTHLVLMEGQSSSAHQITPAISFIIPCKNQSEIDYFWDAFMKGGQPSQCGWIADKFGVNWQVNPEGMEDIMSDPKTAENVFKALLKMTKIDMQKLKDAAK